MTQDKQPNQNEPLKLTEEDQVQTVAGTKQLFDEVQNQFSELSKKLENLIEQKQHKIYPDAALSLGNIPGNVQPPLSAEALIAMDDDDFDRYWQRILK